MRYLGLATDYDGTLATHGTVDEPTLAGLDRLRRSGRKLVMVTGRELDDLARTFSHFDLFDLIVAENGALLYWPATGQEKTLGERPPENFVETLRRRGVGPISVGRVIVATWEPHETVVLEVIRDLGLEYQVIFNKGAVMVLPSGITKATGLAVALKELGLSRHNVVGVGDAENDHAFLRACQCGVAVANSIEALKSHADWITTGSHGAGVVELIDAVLQNDLASVDDRLQRHWAAVGKGLDGGEFCLPVYGTSCLVAGANQRDKDTLASGFLERLAQCGYQYCVIDPEGDFSALEGAVCLGTAERPAVVDEFLELLQKPSQHVVANLTGIAAADRPAWLLQLLARLQQLITRTGRPHWIMINEAADLLPAAGASTGLPLLERVEGMMFVTEEPVHVNASVLAMINTLACVGPKPGTSLAQFAIAGGDRWPTELPDVLPPGQFLLWRRGQAPSVLKLIPARSRLVHHRRMLLEGSLGEEQSFYFHGPAGKLNLRADNLLTFVRLAEGVDDDTWLHHLRAGDYARWFREVLHDQVIAEQIELLESPSASAAESRQAVRQCIEERYAMPQHAGAGQ